MGQKSFNVDAGVFNMTTYQHQGHKYPHFYKRDWARDQGCDRRFSQFGGTYKLSMPFPHILLHQSRLFVH